MTKSGARLIKSGLATLGIELGSTRIKACLIGEDPKQILATGAHDWENQLEDGFWTYSTEAIWNGLEATLRDLQDNVEKLYGIRIKNLKAIGVSAMMHGYLVFDARGDLLVPFRTWRNTNTSAAAENLTRLLGVNIPLRWSVAHLHQAALDKETHVPQIDFVTTLAGYVHWMLTGRKVLGIGDASGMFPIDNSTRSYDSVSLNAFDEMQESNALKVDLIELLPQILLAGENAGHLTQAGAALLDPSGLLQPGVPLCPPEGDAGSGMVATNSVAPTTGNVSAGTSIFAMVVMERELNQVHSELDIVTTPVGDPVAMVHCNNGASELAAWVGLFKQFSELAGQNLDSDKVYEILFREAMNGESDAGGLLAYNYLAGEPITGIAEGRPLFIRKPDSIFSLANVMRSQLYGVFGTLSLGMAVLRKEQVRVSKMSAHGGIFRTSGVAQRILSAAISAPVSLSSRASEGGPWGMALLAAFSVSGDSSLSKFLDEKVFDSEDMVSVQADQGEVEGFDSYLQNYRAGLPILATAIDSLP
jgi:sugar (pentulose or hexulose) kinase